MRFSPQTDSSSLHAALALAGLGLTALAAAPAHAQGLNNQRVDVTARSQDMSTTYPFYHDGGPQTVTPAGATFPAPDSLNLNVFVTPTQIKFTYGGDNTLFFTPSFYDGYAVSETGGSPVTITGVTVDQATNVSGFTSANVASDPTDIFANFQGLAFNPGQNVTLDIVTGAPAVPEASTTVSLGLLLALGMGGVIVAAKRRKTA